MDDFEAVLLLCIPSTFENMLESNSWVFSRRSNVQILKTFLFAPPALADHSFFLVGVCAEIEHPGACDFDAVWLSCVPCAL